VTVGVNLRKINPLRKFLAAFFSKSQNTQPTTMPGNPHQAVSAYSKAAIETATPRQLEARLLLKAAGHLQRVLDHWTDKPSGLSEAVLYNRRLWIIFIDNVLRDDNRLPIAVRQNLLNLGVFVMAETYSLMTTPRPEHAANLISINRRIAAGLEGRPQIASAQAA
jgi:flagellar biosynthesis activator protein FlaF